MKPSKKSGHPPGASDKKGSGANPRKKNKLAGKTVEMSSGNQIIIEEVMHSHNEDTAVSEPKSRKPRQPRPEKTVFDEEPASTDADNASQPFADEGSGMTGQINWKKQAGSIGIWMFSVIMLALTFFPGENFWNLIHRLILGVLGFKAFLWAGLLIFFGYLLTKQIDEEEILNIIRPTSGLILLSDVLGYILIQSDGYRSVYNELSFTLPQLFTQIFKDGEKVGGAGILGGTIGELFILLAGKTGAAIIVIILMSALIMILSKTGPLQLFDQAKRIVRSLLDPEFYRRLFEPDREDTSFGENFDDEAYQEDEPATDVEVFPDDFAEPSDDGMTTEPGTEAELSEEAQSLSEIVKAVSLKKKKKKLTRAEEIQAESEEILKQVESEENASGDSDVKEYKYPTLRLLVPPKNGGSSDDAEELTETAQNLIKTLAEYGVQASISHISRGPTVTRYEVKPAPGVKINKIKNLSDDIALRLAAQSIRIEAPIPGKPAVGIEIPNKNKQMVRIREIIGSQEFTEAKGALTVALGRNIDGNIEICDLSRMPHLLIAGSTGSGKSVCVNSMLISLLYKYSPDDVRMVLIDPKSVEFDMYNGIPHLLVPVVCEPKKAAGALQWAVSEMLKRYSLLKEHGVRNIDGYNQLAERTHDFEKLCRIVIVIDEMADLMIASPKEVEDAIARLAAMARAAGMYMVLATQRPSVDVITGTIKNNIPSRIALSVSSQVDSRTILDMGGAENLIGYGDMLFHPTGTSKNIRIQGCFVEDAEVERVIRFVKQNGLAEYDDSIADEIERNALDNSGESTDDFEGKDEFFEKAVEVVTEAGQASTSMLQRRLGVGYARAGRIIDQLEEHGIIGPHEGSKPRAVLITRTQWMEMTMSRTHAGKNDPLLRNHSEFAAQTLDAGHEEIAARQLEFFNVDGEDDYDDEEENFEGYSDEEETIPEASDHTEEAYNGADIEDQPEAAQDEEITSDEEESLPGVDNRTIDVELEDDTPANAPALSPSPRQESAAFTKSAVAGVEDAVGIGSHKYETSRKKAAKKASSPRDFSVFFDDSDDNQEQMDEFFDFTRSADSGYSTPSTTPHGKNAPKSVVDIPPWEEMPTQDDSQTAENFVSQSAIFSECGYVPPWEEPSIPALSEILPHLSAEDDPDSATGSKPLPKSDGKTARENVLDTTGSAHDLPEDNADDDLFDDVMSSPWIKKL